MQPKETPEYRAKRRTRNRLFKRSRLPDATAADIQAFKVAQAAARTQFREDERRQLREEWAEAMDKAEGKRLDDIGGLRWFDQKRSAEEEEEPATE